MITDINCKDGETGNDADTQYDFSSFVDLVSLVAREVFVQAFVSQAQCPRRQRVILDSSALLTFLLVLATAAGDS